MKCVKATLAACDDEALSYDPADLRKISVHRLHAVQLSACGHLTNTILLSLVSNSLNKPVLSTQRLLEHLGHCCGCEDAIWDGFMVSKCYFSINYENLLAPIL